MVADGHHVPEAAVEVEVVPVRLARAGVAEIGIERMSVVGLLSGAVSPLDGAQLPGHARTRGEWPAHRRPVGRARAVADRLCWRIWSEPVKGAAGRVGEHRYSADRGGSQLRAP